MKLGVIFPGQGSQSVGMGQDLCQNFPAAKQLFEQIDNIAGRSLSNMCFNGPAEELKRTVNTQPSILAVSLIAWTCYRHSGGPEPVYVAGHSLGEFAALHVAQVLSLDSVIHLVEKRAQLMEACPPGAMSAILNMKIDRLRELCESVCDKNDNQKVVVVANFNTEEQIVISGSPDLVAEVSTLAKSEGAKAITLSVGGAFHSPLMSEASKEFNHVLSQCHFANAKFPVIQNVTAAPQSDAAALKQTLENQMTSSVRWYESIKFMLDQGVRDFIEIGPGKALSGMVKRIDKTVNTYNIEDSASLSATIEALKNISCIA